MYMKRLNDFVQVLNPLKCRDDYVVVCVYTEMHTTHSPHPTQTLTTLKGEAQFSLCSTAMQQCKIELFVFQLFI